MPIEAGRSLRSIRASASSSGSGTWCTFERIGSPLRFELKMHDRSVRKYSSEPGRIYDVFSVGPRPRYRALKTTGLVFSRLLL